MALSRTSLESIPRWPDRSQTHLKVRVISLLSTSSERVTSQDPIGFKLQMLREFGHFHPRVVEILK